MIGVIIITHGELGKYLIKTSEAIVGPQEKVVSIALFPDEGIEDLKQKIINALKELDTKEGVIILTDMIGGTPTNTSLSLSQEGNIEVITGVSLPILLKLLSSREVMRLEELADELCKTGQKSIINAKKVFLKKLAKHKN